MDKFFLLCYARVSLWLLFKNNERLDFIVMNEAPCDVVRTGTPINHLLLASVAGRTKHAAQAQATDAKRRNKARDAPGSKRIQKNSKY